MIRRVLIVFWIFSSEYGALCAGLFALANIIHSFLTSLTRLKCLYRSHTGIEDVVVSFNLFSVGDNGWSVSTYRVGQHVFALMGLNVFSLYVKVLCIDGLTLRGKALIGSHALRVVVVVLIIQDQSHRAVIYEVARGLNVLYWSVRGYV